MFHILAEPITSSLHGKKLRLVTRDVTRTLIGGGVILIFVLYPTDFF